MASTAAYFSQPWLGFPYPHVWEGEYAKAFEGAYFARHLEQARQEGRICRVAVDPILPLKAFFDIGGAGHSSDAMAIWIAQFVGREIRLLDYIEGVGQPLAYYAHELRRRGWKDVIIYLPHDGVATNNITVPAANRKTVGEALRIG